MPLCFVDIAVGARAVAVVGLVMASVVVAQLATELAQGHGHGAVAVLLGMTLEEMDSRQRHIPHTDSHDYHLADNKDGTEQEPFDDYVRQVLSCFLSFGCLYWWASGVLAYASLKGSRWGALPWLLLHALSLASQVACLVVQVSQYQNLVSEPQHHPLHTHAMSPHPSHSKEEEMAEKAWDQHVREHAQEHQDELTHMAIVHIAVAMVYMLVCVYAWLVVLVAHRRWAGSRKLRCNRCPGDEGYNLTTISSTVANEKLVTNPLDPKKA